MRAMPLESFLPFLALQAMDGDVYINMRHSKSQFKYAVRRLKRCQNILQNERFGSSLLQGSGNIFEEIKNKKVNRTIMTNQLHQH